MKNSRKILLSLGLAIFLLICLWIYKEVRWRMSDDSTIKIEVSNELDINKVRIIATHRMGDNTIFENGKQVSVLVGVFDQPPPFWDIVYSDSLYSRVQSGYFKDNRQDFDYRFRFYSKNDTVFCEYRRNNEKEIVCLEISTHISKK